MKKKNIPTVYKVEWGKAENVALNIMSIDSDDNYQYDSVQDFKELKMIAPGSITTTIEKVNNVNIYTTVLTFETCDELPDITYPIVFKVYEASGDIKLIGNNARPYPTVGAEIINPSDVSTRKTKIVTVTWSSIFAPYLMII